MFLMSSSFRRIKINFSLFKSNKKKYSRKSFFNPNQIPENLLKNFKEKNEEYTFGQWGKINAKKIKEEKEALKSQHGRTSFDREVFTLRHRIEPKLLDEDLKEIIQSDKHIYLLLGNSRLQLHIIKYLRSSYPHLSSGCATDIVRYVALPSICDRISQYYGINRVKKLNEEMYAPSTIQQDVFEESDEFDEEESDVDSDSFDQKDDLLEEKEFLYPKYNNNIENSCKKDYIPSNSSIFLSIIGLIYKKVGQKDVDDFLKVSINPFIDKIDFENIISIPMASSLVPKYYSQVQYRLLSERGRYSKDSIYNVGVFSNQKCVGEGVGRSIKGAKRNAALNSLLKIYLNKK